MWSHVLMYLYYKSTERHVVGDSEQSQKKIHQFIFFENWFMAWGTIQIKNRFGVRMRKKERKEKEVICATQKKLVMKNTNNASVFISRRQRFHFLQSALITQLNYTSMYRWSGNTLLNNNIHSLLDKVQQKLQQCLKYIGLPVSLYTYTHSQRT